MIFILGNKFQPPTRCPAHIESQKKSLAFLVFLWKYTMYMKNNTQIRQYLGELVSPQNAKEWYTPILFEAHTLSKIPKEITIVSLPPEEEQNYNCFIFMFGLGENTDFIQKTKGFIYSNFIKKLLDEGLLIQIDKPQDDCWVLYKDNNVYAHGGVYKKGTIISKWSWGPTIRHDLWNVPSAYGNSVLFVQPLDRQKVLSLYEKYKEFNTID